MHFIVFWNFFSNAFCVTNNYRSLVFQLDKNGDPVICDRNMVAGRTFLGFASYNLGPISFQDLNSKLEAAEGATVDVNISDLVSADHHSDYSKIKTERRGIPLAKLMDTTQGRIQNFS